MSSGIYVSADIEIGFFNFSQSNLCVASGKTFKIEFPPPSITFFE